MEKQEKNDQEKFLSGLINQYKFLLSVIRSAYMVLKWRLRISERSTSTEASSLKKTGFWKFISIIQ